jgi:hypothetical protein
MRSNEKDEKIPAGSLVCAQKALSQTDNSRMMEDTSQ